MGKRERGDGDRRIEDHLERARDLTDVEDVAYHIREAQQLLRASRQSNRTD